MSKGDDEAKKHMNRVLSNSGTCPSEAVALRRKYSKQAVVETVDKYYCGQCKKQIVDHDNVMRHVGTHIEFYTGKASKYGRDVELWSKLSEDNSGLAEVLSSEGPNSGNNADTPMHDNVNSEQRENIEQLFRGVFGDNTVLRTRENSGAKLTVENRIGASTAAVTTVVMGPDQQCSTPAPL